MFVCLPGYQDLIHELRELFETPFDQRDDFYEYKVGRLFGYRDSDIELFLIRLKKLKEWEDHKG